MSPAISVIIPVFNGAELLREAIESVLAQTYTDFELIVVDDGSTDSTWEVIQSYGSRLRGFRKSNGGVASALNMGIQRAHGEWIAWLSHDDAFLPNKLALQVEIVTKTPWARVCYSDYWVVDEESKRQAILAVPSYARDHFVRHLFQCMFVCGSTVLVHRDCFVAEGLFDESLRYAQDADMWLRLARRFGFVHLATPLIHWRFHVGQGSRKEERMLVDRKEYLSRCLATFQLVDFFPELSSAPKTGRAVSNARRYLALVMLHRHREPGISLQQYALALRSWPSIRNPALLQFIWLILGGWAYFLLGRKIAGLRRKLWPASSKIPPGDLIRASRTVDFPIV